VVDRVKAEVTKRKLTLTPRADGAEVTDPINSSFEVTVTNDSREFASFQLDLSTPGVDETIGEWYKVEPEVCTKKPPGASTTFQVSIVRSPLPVYEVEIDLLLRVFSVEFRHLATTQKLKLTINKPQQPLQLVLPNKAFKASPGDQVDMLVLVYNYSSRPINVLVSCSGLDSTWFSGRSDRHQSEQKLRVDPSYPNKLTFSCQLPEALPIPNQPYRFTIQAIPEVKGPLPPVEQGTLEVLPLGVVEFSCTPQRQQIPVRRQLFRRRSAGATYQLEFKNASNAVQKISVTASPVDQRQCALTLPESETLVPGEIKPLLLVSNQRRDWWRKRRLWFDIEATASELTVASRSTAVSRSTRVVPGRQTLELQVLPVISPWLWLLGGLVILALVVWHLLVQPYHIATVNSVRLDGNASTVFSGSSDQTVLRWQVDNNLWRSLTHTLNFEESIAPNLGKAVRVTRLKPTDNNIIAIGLENGEIQLWDVLGNQKAKTLFSANDRVFDLDFTQDSQYLFSAHGSGQVRQWNLNSRDQKPLKRIISNPTFGIAAIAVYPAQSPLLVLAGQFNQLMLWDWQGQVIYEIPYHYLDTAQSSDYKFNPIVGQHHYVDSVAIANNLLITADNQGYITTWDLQSRQCVSARPNVRAGANAKTNPNATRTRKPPQIIETDQNGFSQALNRGKCEVMILDQWLGGQNGKAVRSIAITQDGRYLASVGDDGQVKLWPLKDGRHEPVKILADFSGSQLHSVDIKTSTIAGYIFVTSDAPQHQVKLYREPISHAGQ
jgi:hypothetical protein